MDPQWQYNPLVIPLGVSTLIILVLIGLGFRQRRDPVAASFLFFMVCLLIWMVTSLLEQLILNLPLSLLVADLSFIGITFFPVAWLALALAYTGRRKRKRGLLAGLSLIPILTNIIIWTNPLHHLWRGESYRDLTTAWFPITIYNYGPWFYAVHAPYSYVISLVVVVLLLRSLSYQQAPYRAQLIRLLIAFFIPLAADVVYVLGFSPIPHYNLSPITFSISGVLVAWTLLGFRFLDLTPIARDLVMENMNDPVVVLDDQDRIIDLNRAAHLNLFQESDGVIGQPLDRLFPDYADLFHDFRGSSSLRQEVEVRGRDQLTYVYDLQISPVTRPSGRQAGRLVMLRDITEQKAVEAERERLIGELESYAHSVAHDLKHPLTLIMGYADILRTAALAGDQAEIEESNQALQRGGERIARIIDDLLMLAQVRRQEDIPVEGLEMGSLVEAALGRLEATVKSRAATVTLPESWPSAVGYASWVEEVWANYLSNALKYGGDPPSLGLGGERQGEQIRYWVKDNGPGLSEAAQRRLFQQFERLDTRRASGHGLGLSIVRRIIERLGGEVGVESVEGEGSLFYFTLPAGQKVDRTR